MSTLASSRGVSSSRTAKPTRGDQSVQAEAASFVKRKAFYPEPCKHFNPSLETLQSTTFSDYIRTEVLRKSERGYEDDFEEEDDEEENHDGEEEEADTEEENCTAGVNLSENHQREGEECRASPSINRSSNRNRTGRRSDNSNNTSSIHSHVPHEKYNPNKPIVYYDYGIAKITLPEGCSSLEGIAKDQTGRGPMWQAGTELGDKVVFNHKQVVRGIGGVYEYVFLEQPPITVAEFRTKADEYLKSQLGSRSTGDEPVEVLERKFWKRLGPTMPPAFYGADMEGTLFDDDDDCLGFNVSRLKSCLQLLLMDQDDGDEKKGIPGVTTPYLYFGMWGSVFCAHTEDMNLLSINYLHAGAPKIWYAVPAGEDSKRFEELMASSYHHAKRDCPEYLRHKRSMISPAILQKAGIPFTTTVQYPGDAIVTYPGSYHFGFNTGFNVAEATNFAVPEWIPYGRKAKVCLCRHDSVRIDLNKFEQLLLHYEREVMQTKRLSWADWVARTKKKRVQEEIANASYGSSPNKVARTDATDPHKRAKEFWVEVVHPAKKSASKKKKSKEKAKKNKKAPKTDWDEEIWHLAKPIGRKSLVPSARVLCIIPAVVTDETSDRNTSKGDDSDDSDDEQCFAGWIVEIHDGHVRIRLDGMSKLDDVWLEATSPKLFLDGGRWEEDNDFKMPLKHYWKVEDSRDTLV